MNVHFFVTFSKDARNSAFAQELKKYDINFRLFSEIIRLHYNHRAWLYFVGWPRMMLFAIRQAWRSLRSTPYPDWIVLNSHFEVLTVTILAKLLQHAKPKIMLMGFIYTSRTSPILAKLKYLYFSKIFQWVDCAFCHSPEEAEKNTKLFASSNAQFSYIPYGLNLALSENDFTKADGEPYAVSAGRSGRDYDLLIRCFTELGYPLHIICDSHNTIKDQPLPNNIQILRQCYGLNYFNQLYNAKIVIIPISVDDISAGQMVLLQAMALKKAIVITNTTTTRHYVEHEKTAILVENGNLEQMKVAVQRLWTNQELCTKLAENAKTSFDYNYSIAAYTKNIYHLLTNFKKYR